MYVAAWLAKHSIKGAQFHCVPVQIHACSRPRRAELRVLMYAFRDYLCLTQDYYARAGERRDYEHHTLPNLSR